MNSFVKVLLLIILNIIISVSATLAVLYYWENIRNAESPYELITIAETSSPSYYETQEEQTENTSVQTITTETPIFPIAVTPTHTEIVPAIRASKINISIVQDPGNLQSEAVRVINVIDDVINLEGWTLEDGDGNKLTFPNIQLLRKGIFIEVYSRGGHDTAFELFWNLSEPVWRSGETVVIKDTLGQIQATYRIP